MIDRPVYYVCDALPILAAAPSVYAGIATSLPDEAEIIGVADYPAWFANAARLTMLATCDEGVTVFAQTDRKAGGKTISKAHILHTAADATGRRLLWHKVVLRHPTGRVDLYRPGYTHILAFSVTGRPGRATPDVIPPGIKPYPNSLTAETVAVMAEACSRSAPVGGTLLDPFCGRGSIVRALASMGHLSEGWDIDPDQIAQCVGAGAQLILGD